MTGLVAQYGYAAVALLIFLESLGLPLPGEAVLLAAAVYAGTADHLDIAWVIAAAWLAATFGGMISFRLGLLYGFPLLSRYGRYIGLSRSRLKLGQLLFLRHGGKAVFFGRFITALRAWGSLLAGANRMPARRFLWCNAAGALAWAGGYGSAAYLFGSHINRIIGPLGLSLAAVAVVCLAGGFLWFRRHEQRLTAEADRILPDL